MRNGTPKQNEYADKIRQGWIDTILSCHCLTDKGREFVAMLTDDSMAWLQAKDHGRGRVAFECAMDIAECGIESDYWLHCNSYCGSPVFGKYCSALLNK